MGNMFLFFSSKCFRMELLGLRFDTCLGLGDGAKWFSKVAVLISILPSGVLGSVSVLGPVVPRPHQCLYSQVCWVFFFPFILAVLVGYGGISFCLCFYFFYFRESERA